jgi:transcriptional regulator with XRE-family HTH domain
VGDSFVNEKESLGKYLWRERETRKISLKEVSKKIKIREQFLKAVEEDRHDLLPSPTYVKGFLSAYARYLGINPSEVILRYETALKGEPAPRKEVPLEKKISWNEKYLWAIGGAIIVAFVAFYLLLFPPSKPPMQPVSPKPAVKKIPSPPPPPSEGAGKVPVSEEKPVRLQLRAIERTWVSIHLDDQPEQDIMLQPGEGISYQARKRIQLFIGNAGGLDLIFNDKRLEKVGKSGEVLTVILTPQGVETKRRENPQPGSE